MCVGVGLVSTPFTIRTGVEVGGGVGFLLNTKTQISASESTKKQTAQSDENHMQTYRKQHPHPSVSSFSSRGGAGPHEPDGH